MAHSYPWSRSSFRPSTFISPRSGRRRSALRGPPLAGAGLDLYAADRARRLRRGQRRVSIIQHPCHRGTLNVGLTSDVVTLDPLLSSALVDREVMLNLYDTLVSVDAENKVQPDLATSWSYTSPTQLVFTLRTDVKFQDGIPFNAEAVVFNINRILNAASSPRKSELATVKSVEAVDTSHVQFNLTAPFSPLLATLTDRSGMMLSPAVVQAAGADIANNPLKAGSGPFQFGLQVVIGQKASLITYLDVLRYLNQASAGAAAGLRRYC